MEKVAPMSLTNARNDVICTRQLAFFVAFFLPVGKLLELPSLLAHYAGSDLLIAAFLGTVAEFLAFLFLVLFCKRTGETPLSFVKLRLGKLACGILVGIYTLFLLLFSALPILDLERFSHAAFSDTAPSFFVFTPFFFFSAFVCTKGLKGLGRSADLTPVLFLLPTLALLIMSVGQADFSRLLPVMEKPITVSLKAALKTAPYFSAGALLLPVCCGYRYEEGAEAKLLPAFGAGSALFLIFLAVFFSVFGTLGEKEHYALMKTAQFFPALRYVGRIDLLMVYLVTVVLFFYTALPLQLSVDGIRMLLPIKTEFLPSAIINLAAFVFVLICNKRTAALQRFFLERLSPLFLFFSLALPILLFLFSLKKEGGRGATNEKIQEKRGNE